MTRWKEREKHFDARAVSVPDFAADRWHIGRMASFSAWVLEPEAEV
jgi:hypothetical protein